MTLLLNLSGVANVVEAASAGYTKPVDNDFSSKKMATAVHRQYLVVKSYKQY